LTSAAGGAIVRRRASACYEKVEELDDSGGNFGMFVVTLYCGWIKARQAARADADETRAA